MGSSTVYVPAKSTTSSIKDPALRDISIQKTLNHKYDLMVGGMITWIVEMVGAFDLEQIELPQILGCLILNLKILESMGMIHMVHGVYVINKWQESHSRIQKDDEGDDMEVKSSIKTKILKKLKNLEKGAREAKREIYEIKRMVTDMQIEVSNINDNVEQTIEFLGVPPQSFMKISSNED
ncbi:conserved hypothetical protein [Ricinus communis]|uniref:Uncharacterized protein n=1 Tax=Ricinus communis TaxID=3988 RepID=B9RPL2_RICCO|nr:conserved hypothetical protein [Ricinus communis]